jgi:hypothetical protein
VLKFIRRFAEADKNCNFPAEKQAFVSKSGEMLKKPMFGSLLLILFPLVWAFFVMNSVPGGRRAFLNTCFIFLLADIFLFVALAPERNLGGLSDLLFFLSILSVEPWLILVAGCVYRNRRRRTHDHDR